MHKYAYKYAWVKNMGKKARTTLTIDEEILRKAQEIGLNVSQFCENALKQAIKALEQTKIQTETNGGYIDTRSVSFPQDWWAGPDLNRRSSPREGDVLTTLDYRPAKVKE